MAAISIVLPCLVDRARAYEIKIFTFFVAFAVLISVLLIATTVHRAVQQGYQSEQRDQVLYRMSALRWRLEAGLNLRLYVTEALIPYVLEHPNLNQAEFAGIAKRLIDGRRGIRSIQLAKDSVVSHIYPRAGNEAALGLRLLELDSQSAAVKRALDSRQTVVAGPVDLVQGGRAFVARTPIYLPSEDRSQPLQYWGLATILLDVEDLLLEAGVAGESHALRIGLRGFDALGNQGDEFYGPSWRPGSKPVETTVVLPNGSWVMSAAPIGGWEAMVPGTKVGWGFAIVAAVLMASFAYFLVRTPVRLREEVSKATHALEQIQLDLEARVAQRTSELQELNDTLRERERRLEEAQRIGHIGNWVWRIDGGGFDWSEEMYRIYGALPGLIDCRYEAMMQRVHPEDRIDVARAVQAAMNDCTAFCIDHRLVLDGGKVRSVRFQGEVDRELGGDGVVMAGTLQDITERIEAESRLFRLAHYDVLTGLPNRALLRDRLEHALKFAYRNHHAVALVILDIDRFKHFNDSLGQALGDELLADVAHRIQRMLRSDDTLARLGGDEFAVVLEGVNDSDQVAIALKKIFDALGQPIELPEQDSLYITACAGISLYPSDGRTVDSLLKHAALALYKAKEDGRNRYHFFSSDLGARALERVKIESEMRRAIQNGEFVLHYQPLVNTKRGVIAGFEALVRWQHPQRGMVSPLEFIPIAEESGLIEPLGLWVMEEACRQHRQWQLQGLRPPPVHINLSAHQFKNESLAQALFGLLAKYQLAPEHIGLEVTESVLMQDTAVVIRTLNALKEGGIHISIDDFGTGHSSLSYLKRFDIDCLKIDRSFVRDVTTDSDDLAIVEAVILMAHQLGLTVVAEGIEQVEQLSILCRLHCDVGQGYYFSPPMAAAAVPAYLDSNDGAEKLGVA